MTLTIVSLIPPTMYRRYDKAASVSCKKDSLNVSTIIDSKCARRNGGVAEFDGAELITLQQIAVRRYFIVIRSHYLSSVVDSKGGNAIDVIHSRNFDGAELVAVQQEIVRRCSPIGVIGSYDLSAI